MASGQCLSVTFCFLHHFLLLSSFFRKGGFLFARSANPRTFCCCCCLFLFFFASKDEDADLSAKAAAATSKWIHIDRDAHLQLHLRLTFVWGGRAERSITLRSIIIIWRKAASKQVCRFVCCIQKYLKLAIDMSSSSISIHSWQQWCRCYCYFSYCPPTRTPSFVTYYRRLMASAIRLLPNVCLRTLREWVSKLHFFWFLFSSSKLSDWC